MYTSTVLSMLDVEHSIIAQLFPPQLIGEIDVRTCIQPLQDFKTTFSALNAHVRSHLSSDLFLAYELLEQIRIAIRSLNAPEKEPPGQQVELLSALHEDIRSTALMGTADFIEDIRRKSTEILALPPDCRVTDLTMEVILKVRTLLSFSEILSELLADIGEGRWLKPSSAPMNRANIDEAGNVDTSLWLLTKFIMDIAEVLLGCLDGKAKALLRKSMSHGLFMLNNIVYMRQSLSSLDLGSDTVPMNEMLQKAQKRALDSYLDGYKNCVEHLLDVTYVRGGIGGSINKRSSLSNKEREQIKDKFKGFNTEFDEIVRLNRVFVVQDSGLRSQLLNEIQRVVVPLYSRFYDK